MRAIEGLLLIALLTVTCVGQTRVSGTVKIDGRDKPVQDRSGVVVWLASTSKASAPQPPAHAYRLTQKNKHFEPHLLVVPQGAQVEFPNKDPFFHNVFSLHDNVRFDLGLYESGSSKTVKFTKPGPSFIFCNIHPEMSAVVMVMDSPYYGVTDTNGAFSIEGVPPGEYTLNVWYEKSEARQLKALKRAVVIGTAPATIDDIHLQLAPGVADHHKNKYGQDYEAQPTYKLP